MKYDQLVRILENDALTRDLAIPSWPAWASCWAG